MGKNGIKDRLLDFIRSRESELLENKKPCPDCTGVHDRYVATVGVNRLVEILPGAAVWLTLTLAVVMSRVAPIWVMYFIILFDMYWVLRVSYFVFLLLVSWRRYRRDLKTDWLGMAEVLPGFDDIHHLIILPTYKEEIDVLRTTFDSITAARYPISERFIIVLAGEEGDREHFLENVEIIRREYGDKFFRFIATVHPKGLAGEIPGKGSNAHYAGHRVKELIDGLGIPYEKIIVSTFDCDTCVHPQYFSCVAYKYLTVPNPTRASYQPVALFNNNAWDASPVVRVGISGTTFWLMSELVRPERLFTFSSHSMSFKALVDVDFWERDIVSEDSRIFLQCMLHYDGDYRVVPIYMPVSMDMVQSETHGKSLVDFYKQQRRWAWGVEHFPYLIRRFRANPRIPLRKKLYYMFTLTEGMYSWATAPLLIFLLGYLPLWLAAEPVRAEVFYQNTPHVLEMLMRLAMVGVIVSAIVGFALLPPRPSHKRRRSVLIMILQWVMVPVTFVVFGSIPAIDAQTRLMLGKYLGFKVTKKKRKPVADVAEAAAATLS